MRIAANSASYPDSWHRPSSSWNPVLDNVPVCVAAKSIEDGRYIFANRAFERFSRFFPRQHRRQTRRRNLPARHGGSIAAADRGCAGFAARTASSAVEIVVERGMQKRVLASNRVVARRRTRNRPEFF